MTMSLRLRCMIARSKHRAADVSVETETQFGPATSPPDQGAKSHQPAFGVVASGTFSVQSGIKAAERLRTEPCDPHCRTRHGRTLSRSRRQPICGIGAFGFASAAGAHRRCGRARLCGGVGYRDSRQGRRRNRPDREGVCPVGAHLAGVFTRATEDHWPTSGAAAIDGAEAGAQPYCVGCPAGRLLDAEAEQLGSTSVQAFEIEGLIGARRARAFTGSRRAGPMAMSGSRCWGHSQPQPALPAETPVDFPATIKLTHDPPMGSTKRGGPTTWLVSGKRHVIRPT
jgi:hypothetical protein